MQPVDKPVEILPIDKKFAPESITSVVERKDDILATTGEELETVEAKSRLQQYEQQAFQNIISQGQMFGVPAEEILQKAEELGRKRFEFEQNPEFIAEQALTVNNDAYSDAESRIATNMQIAQEIILEKRKLAEEDKGFVGYAGDFVDRYLFRQMPIGAIEDLTRRTERKSFDILNAVATLSPKEFRVTMQQYADEVSEEGVFFDDNWFAVAQLQTELESAGFDPYATSQQLFGILDLAPFVGAGAKLANRAVNTSMKSTTQVGRAGAIAGEEAAAEASENILRNVPDAETLGNSGPSALDLNPQPVRPSAARFQNKMQETQLAKSIDQLGRVGVFGRVVSKDEILNLAEKTAEKFARKVVNPLNNFNLIEEGLGNYVVAMRFGKADDGRPFLPNSDGSIPDSVTRLAENLEGAQVVPIDPQDTSKGYVVEAYERMNISGMAPTLNIDLAAASGVVRGTAGKLFNNELMGSAALRDAEILTNLSNMAEGGRAAVKEILEPYINKLSKLDGKSRFTLQAVYSELRDGADSVRRIRYSTEEFKTKFKQYHPDGKEATQKDIEAYEALSDVEEADYLLRTSNILQRYVQKGYTRSVEIGPDIYVPAKKVSREALTESDEVKDLSSGIVLRKSDIEDTDVPIWRLDTPTIDGDMFVTKPSNVRIVEPTDVMGYNPGGTRVNPNGRYFIVAGQKGKRLRALMTAFSKKQADTALEQLSTIKKAIDEGNPDIDDIIKANNDWNPSIQTFDELNEFLEKEGWFLQEADIGIKARDEGLIEGEVVNSDVWTGMKADDYLQNDLRRRDKVLTDFGGGKTYNPSPVDTILSQFGEAVYTYSNRAYAQSAMVGWVKKVQEMGRTNWFPEGVSPNDYEILFRNAEVTGTDPVARRMRELQNITMRRLNMKDEGARYLENFGATVAEYVFDKTGIKLGGFDPVNSLLTLGFQSSFGFLNLSQFFMQGFHATTIMAISPKYGLKGAALTIPLRNVLRAKTQETLDLAIERLAKASDMSIEDTKELVEYIKTSGRAVVDGDAAEDGTGIGYNISGFNGDNMSYSYLNARLGDLRKLSSKGLDMGLMPFKAGERLSRLTAINTAFLEFKAKNPNISALSDLGRQTITKREQTLTFNMTSQSRGKVQAGLMKVPTQWLTYTMRSLESVFVGRDLTVAERARLFAVLGPMYGLTGLGLGSAAGYVGEKIGVEPDSSLYIGLKYGLIDAVADYVGAPVALGDRLAPVGAIADVYKKVFEDETYLALLGPSGEIGQNLSTSFLDAFDSLKNGHTVSLTEDMLKILRQPSGIDNVAKAIGIFNNGIYRSKNGIVAPGEMGIAEGITTLTGFTPIQVVEFYNSKGDEIYNKKDLTKFRKEINTDAEMAFRLIDTGDEDEIKRGIKLIRELHQKIALSGYPYQIQRSLRNSATSRMESDFNRLRDSLARQDKFYELKALESIVEKGKE